jgi:hypothetical protein
MFAQKFRKISLMKIFMKVLEICTVSTKDFVRTAWVARACLIF